MKCFKQEVKKKNAIVIVKQEMLTKKCDYCKENGANVLSNMFKQVHAYSNLPTNTDTTN